MLLQTVVENSGALNSSVNQLTESTIKLSEAAANFGALKVMFGVFIVFIFVMMLFYLYQMITYSKKIGDIHSSSKKIEEYFEEASNRTLGKAQASVLIRRAFNSLAQNIKYTILRTRLENKIGENQQETGHRPEPGHHPNFGGSGINRDTIQSKIARLVNYEYAELGSFLTNFDCDDKVLAETVNLDDTQIIVDFMMEQIFLPGDEYTISNMDKETDILLNGIKLEVLKKLG